jgi:hypothetical protein
MRKIWSGAAALASAAALVLAASTASVATTQPTQPSAARARVIATFGSGDAFAESATLDAHGNAVVSVTYWGATDNVGRLWVVRPDGRKTQLGPDIALGGCAMILGVDLDAVGNAYVAVFNFDPASCGTSSPASGLLKVTHRSVSQLTTLPDGSWPNGVDVVGSYAYVTDSLGGSVWKVRTDRATEPATPWLVSTLLAPYDDPDLALGADGVLYRDGTLWLTSYAQGLIVKVPVRRDGSAGKPVVAARDPRLVTADGIAFDCTGTLWVAVNRSTLPDGSAGTGALVTVTPRGTVSRVAFAEGHLDYPTQALWLPGHRLLVVNGSYDVMAPNVTVFTR